jgi:hypothetical protein
LEYVPVEPIVFCMMSSYGWEENEATNEIRRAEATPKI